MFFCKKNDLKLELTTKIYWNIIFHAGFACTIKLLDKREKYKVNNIKLFCTIKVCGRFHLTFHLFLLINYKQQGRKPIKIKIDLKIRNVLRVLHKKRIKIKMCFQLFFKNKRRPEAMNVCVLVDYFHFSYSTPPPPSAK